MVSVYVPGAADFEAVKESVGSPDPDTVLELKLADTPEGRPYTASCTLPVKLPCACTLVVKLVLAPCATFAEVGFTVTLKSGGGGTLVVF